MAFVGLWAVVTGYKFWFGMVSPLVVLKDVLAIVVSFTLLQAQGSDLVTNIYDAAMDLMVGMARVSFTLGPNAPAIPDNGIEGLMRATEDGVGRVFAVAGQALDSAGKFDVAAWLFAGLLVLPYFLIVVGFFAKVVVAVFRIMMIGIFTPFLILGFAFGWGREMAKSGFKTLLSSVFVLFAASAAVGLLLYGVDTLHENITPEQARGEGLFSSDYLTILMLGWVGAALMTEGIGLANSIAGTALSNTAAAVITAGVTASAGVAWRHVAKPGLAGGGNLVLKEGLARLLPGVAAGLGIEAAPTKQLKDILTHKPPEAPPAPPPSSQPSPPAAGGGQQQAGAQQPQSQPPSNTGQAAPPPQAERPPQADSQAAQEQQRPADTQDNSNDRNHNRT